MVAKGLNQIVLSKSVQLFLISVNPVCSCFHLDKGVFAYLCLAPDWLDHCLLLILTSSSQAGEDL